jgi:hypothetical protein
MTVSLPQPPPPLAAATQPLAAAPQRFAEAPQPFVEAQLRSGCGASQFLLRPPRRPDYFLSRFASNRQELR